MHHQVQQVVPFVKVDFIVQVDHNILHAHLDILMEEQGLHQYANAKNLTEHIITAVGDQLAAVQVVQAAELHQMKFHALLI